MNPTTPSKYSEAEALKWVSEQRANAKGERIVLTNGVFDLLHVGHLRCLQFSRSLGEKLIVCVNSDAAVKELKGPSRPIVSEADRAEMLLGLKCVDHVLIFHEKRLGRIIKLLSPDVYCKGGDYSLETIDASEHEALEEVGTEIHFYSTVAGKSSTNLISKMST